MRVFLVSAFALLALILPAASETASKDAEANPSKSYSFFKRELKKLGVSENDAEIRRRDSFVPLSSCSASSDYIGDDDNEDSILRKIADLAYEMVYLEAAMKVAGYPASLWKADLEDYEKTNLAAIKEYKYGIGSSEDKPALQRLAKKLNEYKKASRHRYKDIILGAEGCGAGEIQVKIPTTPAAQRVQYINVVKYKLCTQTGHDPKGPDCDLWVDYSVDAKDGAMMSGKYKIRVTWSDGTTTFRDLNVDDFPENNTGIYSYPIKR